MSFRICKKPQKHYDIAKVQAHFFVDHYCTADSLQNLIDSAHYSDCSCPSEEENVEKTEEEKKKSKATARRRNRRNKLKSLKRAGNKTENNNINEPSTSKISDATDNLVARVPLIGHERDIEVKKEDKNKNMSDNQSRADVLAARQGKKQARAGKAKGKDAEIKEKAAEIKKPELKQVTKPIEVKEQKLETKDSPKSKDEVDKAIIKEEPMAIGDEKSKEQIKAERAAKKAAKQAKKIRTDEVKTADIQKPVIKQDNVVSKPVNEEMTVRDVVETLRGIANVAKDIKEVTEKVSTINLGGKQSHSEQAKTNKDKPDETGKSKAELKAERRAKQEAQRAAKQAALEQKVVKPKVEVKATPDRDTPSKDEKATKQKTLEKVKPKSQSAHRINWFQHLYKEHDKESLKSIPINSHLHPAIIKLGVQLASRVVIGSNARCVALLDALKKMVRDYTLPAKTEFSRGLESHLATSLEFLWAMRPPSASQSNAVKFFRYHLTQLPNNVDEFDAKKTLQEEIDRYIREQIDMAGEAISIAVRNKISNGDNILTYGCSSLIERILREAWSAGLQFRTVVVGHRVHAAPAQMLRRLVAHGLPCSYVDITALSCVMPTIKLVVVGAGALLLNGSVLGALGTAQVALAARARNVPVLVACETHKFSDRVQTDSFVYNEIGDPDDLIDKSDENSPLKDWRSNPNLTPLNLTYDVTPASLVTAVVTELAILPCTSAPVVLRFKLSEYSV